MRKRRNQMRLTAAAMLAAVATGAFADGLPSSVSPVLSVTAGQPVVPVIPEAQVEPQRWHGRRHWTRSTRIEHLEQVEHRLQLRAERLQAEGMDARAATLQHRAEQLRQRLDRLRADDLR